MGHIGSTRAFVALDTGTATTAVSLVARVAGAWRLLGSTAAPAGVPPEAVIERLRRRLADAEPDLARALRLGSVGSAADLPRAACSTTRPPELAVVAATQRVLKPLTAVAATAGWRVRPLVLDGSEILPVATALADPRVTAVLAGASDPPGADERGILPDLASVVAAATDRRPDLVTVLAGGLAAPGQPGGGAVPRGPAGGHRPGPVAADRRGRAPARAAGRPPRRGRRRPACAGRRHGDAGGGAAAPRRGGRGGPGRRDPGRRGLAGRQAVEGALGVGAGGRAAAPGVHRRASRRRRGLAHGPARPAARP